jgi:hypothetical protein
MVYLGVCILRTAHDRCEVVGGAEQRVNLCMDARSGNDSWWHGCRSSFVSWLL